MGTWGYAINEDDTARDAYDDYMDLLNAKVPPAQIEVDLRERFAEELADDDDLVRVELGIAKAKWECGHVTPATFARIKKLVDSDAGMALWEDAGPKAAAKRRKVLETFLTKLQTPNPRPKKPRKPTILKPVFSPGNCLALRHTASGRYAAAIVLLSPVESPRPGQDTYGINSVGFLDYFEATPPGMELFRRRQWLYVKSTYRDCPDEWVIAVDHPNALLWKIVNGKRLVKLHGKPEISVVGQEKLCREDALNSTFTVSWLIGDSFVRRFEAYAQNRKNPAMKRRRSHADLLEHYPEVRDRLHSLGAKSRELTFDFSPLEQD